MRIDKLSLLNFRCFKQLDITFDEHITILVAPNGAGKTTVLDAVRLALFPFIRGFDASLYVKDKSLAIRTEKRQPGCSINEENSRHMKIRWRRSLPAGVSNSRNEYVKSIACNKLNFP